MRIDIGHSVLLHLLGWAMPTPTEDEWVAIITAVGVIGVAMIGLTSKILVDQKHTRTHTAAMAAEMKPNHGSSFRDAFDGTLTLMASQDRRLDRIENVLDLVLRGVGAVRQANGRQDDELGELRAGQAEMAEQLARRDTELDLRMGRLEQVLTPQNQTGRE